MYQLVIAEDETVIREGLRSVLDWKTLGFHIAALAQNGEEALEIVRSRRVDVVLADICMPRMDGLTLLREIRTCSPDTQVVFITSHADFEYARTAVDYKAYILKLDLFEQLEPLLRHLKSDLDASEHRRREDQSNRRFVADRQLLDTLRLGAPLPVGLLPLDATCFQVLAARGEGAVTQWSDSRMAGDRWVASCQNREDVLLLIGGTCEAQLSEKRAACVRAFGGTERMPMAAGHLVHTPSGVSRCYYEAMKLLDCLNGGFVGAQRPLVYSESDFRPTGPQARWPADDMARLLLQDDVALFEAHAWKYVDTCRFSREMLVTDCRACFLAGFGYAVQLGGEACKKEYQVLASVLQACDSFEMLLKAVTDAARAFLPLAQDSVQRVVDLDQIMDYITRNFNTDLHLQEVAAHFFVSVPYLSALLKKRTGRTFGEHVRVCRLQWAAHLLANTALPVASISEEVGYQDHKYFTRLFREFYGLSPAAYRKVHQHTAKDGASIP